MDFSACGTSWNTNYYDSTQFKAPSINPNNLNEFCYLYSNSNKPSDFGIYKYNMSTGIKTRLTSGLTIIGQPKWGKNGWIIFIVTKPSFYEVYKIKSDGDSLTRLTTGFPDIFPDWNMDGSKIIFNRSTYLASPTSWIMIADKNGVTIDSITNQYYRYGACNKNDELALPPISSSFYGITLVNLNSKSETLLYNPTNEASIEGIAWHPNGDDIYFTGYLKGLYKLNKTTKQITLIKSFCTSKSYTFLSVSPDGTFFLVQRVDGRVVNCNPWYKSTIYKVSLDGKTETKIVME